MDCGRRMIYFSTYENGVKTKRSGYAGIFIRGNACDMQLYYRDEDVERKGEIRPIYMFRDGTVTEGAPVLLEEGMAAITLHTGRSDFMQSGRCLEELEVIYLDGVASGICGGRPDGRELTEEAAYTLTDWMDTVTEVIPKCKEEFTEEEETIQKEAEVPLLTAQTVSLPEIWTLAEFMERLPELKLPPDGMRRKCCRMTLEDMEHLKPEWAGLRENHFLLHGYYEYHHLLLAQ